jgi:hypothetical protein
LVQVEDVRVVDLDIAAKKSDICAIRVVDISEAWRRRTAWLWKLSVQLGQKLSTGLERM